MLLDEFKKGVYYFAELLANFTNIILLAIVYWTVIALTAIIAKISKKKFLNYSQGQWNQFCQEKDKNCYFRQF